MNTIAQNFQQHINNIFVNDYKTFTFDENKAISFNKLLSMFKNAALNQQKFFSKPKLNNYDLNIKKTFFVNDYMSMNTIDNNLNYYIIPIAHLYTTVYLERNICVYNNEPLLIIPIPNLPLNDIYHEQRFTEVNYLKKIILSFSIFYTLNILKNTNISLDFTSIGSFNVNYFIKNWLNLEKIKFSFKDYKDCQYFNEYKARKNFNNTLGFCEVDTIIIRYDYNLNKFYAFLTAEKKLYDIRLLNNNAIYVRTPHVKELITLNKVNTFFLVKYLTEEFLNYYIKAKINYCSNNIEKGEKNYDNIKRIIKKFNILDKLHLTKKNSLNITDEYKVKYNDKLFFDIFNNIL